MPLPKATVIMNARSGAQDAVESARNLRELANKRGAEWQVRLARRPRDLRPLTREAIRDGYELIIAGGGDGTINAVASVVVEEGATLGTLPLGTFNYLARDLGMPLELEDAFEALCDGETVEVPVAEVNGQVFLNNASIGIYPMVLEVREDTYRRWGRSQLAAYASVLVSLGRWNRILQLRVVADGSETTIDTPMLFAARNAHQIESFSLDGTQCIRAGRIAFYVLPPVGRLGLLRLALRTLFRRMQRARDFHLLCADTVHVVARGRRLAVAYDGERMTATVPLTFRVHDRRLKVLAPRVLAETPTGESETAAD